MAAKKKTKKTEAKKAPAKKPAEAKIVVEKIVAEVIMPSGLVKLSDGGRTSTSRGIMGFNAKVGDEYKLVKGVYKKV